MKEGRKEGSTEGRKTTEEKRMEKKKRPQKQTVVPLRPWCLLSVSKDAGSRKGKERIKVKA
jgi:hypothetical protein